MKKFFIIVLMLTYGLTSSGMTINLHYCCGKLDGVSFSGKQEKSCEMGNHFKKSGCCNDKQISASIDSDHHATTKWIQASKQVIVAPVYYTTTTSLTGYKISVDRLARGTPSPPLSIPLFIKNRVFRI